MNNVLGFAERSEVIQSTDAQRSLAHIEVIRDIQPIPNYDRVEYASVLGWWVIVSKADMLKVGDEVIYVEIDGRVPSTDERWAFLAKRDYKVRTIKMCGVYSQGLIVPISVFPELAGKPVGTDVTKELGIVYAKPEDNVRKAEFVDKRTWWQKFINFFGFGKKPSGKKFPTQFEYIKKTDEVRVENCPWVLKDKEPWVKSQKVDGTSSTYILEKKPFGRYEYYVCSRSVRQLDRKQKNWHNENANVEKNVYWDMSDKYHIYDFLKDYLIKNNLKYVCLQGETAGPNIQGNPHKFKEVCFFGYNLIRSDTGRMGSIEAAKICKKYGIPWVPIADKHYILPDDMETLKLDADGECLVGKGLREGWVYRSLNGKKSFKNVSRKYLLKHGG